MAFIDEIFDFRYNPFTGVFTPKPIGYSGNPVETQTIPSIANYYVFLKEIPKQDVPSTLIITEQGGSAFSEVGPSTPPAAGQFRAIYGTDGSNTNGKVGQGIVEFNAADAGKIVEIKYYGLGTIIQRDLIKRMDDNAALYALIF